MLLEGLLDSEVVHRDMEEKRAEVTNIEIIQGFIHRLVCMQKFVKAELRLYESIKSFLNLISIA